MVFEDRVSAYPNRYVITDENGRNSYVVINRADEPIVNGTPLNAETFNGMLAGLHPAVESGSHPGCYYRMAEDGEREWINPPLDGYWIGYRTTKRYNDKPVWTTKFVHTMPNNTSNFLSFNFEGRQIISYSAVDVNRGIAFPVKYAEYIAEENKTYTREIDLYVTPFGCGAVANFDASGWRVEITLEYIFV